MREEALTEAEEAMLRQLNRPPEERRRRNEAARALLKSWLADESGYDERIWPLVKEGLERERARLGQDKLFAD